MMDNNKITLDHDYAQRILQKRKEYIEAWKVLKENGIQFQTLYPACLRVFLKDTTTTYETVEEATKDLKER